MSQPTSLRVHCMCKALSATLVAPPIFSGYCHCTRCQRRQGAPLGHSIMCAVPTVQWENATKTLDDGTAVPETYKLVPGWDLGTDAPNTSGSALIQCTRCDGRIGGYVPKMKAYVLSAAAFERYDASAGAEKEGKIKDWDVIKPTAHSFYPNRAMDVKDGLKKYEGFAGYSAEVEE